MKYFQKKYSSPYLPPTKECHSKGIDLTSYFRKFPNFVERIVGKNRVSNQGYDQFSDRQVDQQPIKWCSQLKKYL